MEFMKAAETYKDPELTLGKLAAMLKLTPHQLSEISEPAFR